MRQVSVIVTVILLPMQDGLFTQTEPVIIIWINYPNHLVIYFCQSYYLDSFKKPDMSLQCNQFSFAWITIKYYLHVHLVLLTKISFLTRNKFSHLIRIRIIIIFLCGYISSIFKFMVLNSVIYLGHIHLINHF